MVQYKAFISPYVAGGRQPNDLLLQNYIEELTLNKVVTQPLDLSATTQKYLLISLHCI